MFQIQIFEIRPEWDVAGYRPAYPGTVMAAQLLCMLMICIKLHNLCINNCVLKCPTISTRSSVLVVSFIYLSVHSFFNH